MSISNRAFYRLLGGDFEARFPAARTSLSRCDR